MTEISLVEIMKELHGLTESWHLHFNVFLQCTWLEQKDHLIYGFSASATSRFLTALRSLPQTRVSACSPLGLDENPRIHIHFVPVIRGRHPGEKYTEREAYRLKSVMVRSRL
jgi:hypothetical protein